MTKLRAVISARAVEKEIVLDRGGGFSIRLPDAGAVENAFLVIDIYALDNPVHPEGHIGWWRYEIGASPAHLTGSLSRDQGGRITPEIDGAAAVDEWCNPTVPDARRMELLIVLRSSITNAILSKDRVPVFLTAEESDEFRSLAVRDHLNPRYRHFALAVPAGRTVHIISKSMFERDAVGNLCFGLYKLLMQAGMQVRLFADDFDLALNDLISRRELLADSVRTEDVIVYFFSTFDEEIEDIAELACSCRVAYYHGITPPQLLQVFDPEVAAQSAKAIRQVPLLARFDRLAVNSRASADELLAAFAKSGLPVWDEIAVIAPKILSEAELQAPEAGRELKVDGSPNLLFVGRVKSHKRIDDLLTLLAELRRLDPDARCMIVGAADTPAYSDYLNWMQTKQLRLPEDSVSWLGTVSDEALARAYSEATVYVSMSEHEGFGLPILEAMIHDVPVFCFGSPSIRELLGTSGAIFVEKSFPSLASRLHDLISSPARLTEQLRSQRERVSKLIGEMDGAGFLQLLTETSESGTPSVGHE